ncbi:MAG: ATP-grasp domain-containing protein [Candidatus Eremiobacterota bacterium]
MRIIFCSNPLENNKPDFGYEKEYDLAKACNFTIELFDFEELIYNDNPIKAIKNISHSEKKETAIYRGWMLKPHYYEKFYEALKKKNIILFNNPAQYNHCHYFPESYEIIKDFTPFSIWLKKEDLNYDRIYEEIKKFGRKPVIIKDFVKSCKDRWEEACFIHDASDKDHVKKVVDRFLELQGDDLNDGLIFREFVKLQFLSLCSKSAMPLSKEFRVFILDGKPLVILNYWDEGDYGDIMPDLSGILHVAERIKSRFFTVDIGIKEDGEPVIIETGDGQVAGLPKNADIMYFYKKIAELMR